MFHVASVARSDGERIHVVPLERVDVPVQQCAARVVERLGVTRILRLVAGHRRPSALEGAVDRRDRGPQQLRDLLRAPAQHLAEDEDGPLSGREVLERGNERQPHRLSRDRHVRGIAIGHDTAVRHRLDPDRLGKRRRKRRVGALGRVEVHGPRAALARSEHREADVGGDAVQPGAKRRAALELVVGAPRTDERLLDGVLRLEGGSEHPIAVAGELGPEGLELRHHLGRRRRHRSALGGRVCHSAHPTSFARSRRHGQIRRPSPPMPGRHRQATSRDGQRRDRDRRRASAASAGSWPEAT